MTLILMLILKTLGFLLLVILFLFLIVLFVPVSFRVRSSAEDLTNGFGGLTVNVRVSWLFSIVWLRYTQHGTQAGELVMRLFGIKLKRRKPKMPKMDSTEDKHVAATQAVTEDEAEVSAQAKTISHEDLHDHEPDTTKRDKDSRFFERIGERIKNLNDQRIKWKNEWDRIPDKRGILNQVLLLIKRIPRMVFWGFFRLKAHFGFTDPSATGTVLGYSYTALGVFGWTPYVELSGDFEKKCLTYDLSTGGMISVFTMLLPVLRFVFSKPVWKVVMEYIFKRRDDRNGRKRKQQPANAV